MVARAVAGRCVHDLARGDLDSVVAENVIDAHGRALVRVDEIGRHRVPAPGVRNGIAEAEPSQRSEHVSAAFDELIDGGLGVGREAAERFDQAQAVDVILGADAVEIAADDDAASQPLDQPSEIERLVLGW